MSQMNTPAGPAGPAGQKPVSKIFHEEVTEKIIAQLKDGAAPWQKTWAAGELRPAYNPASDVLYSGLNRLNLGGEGFADPRFMSLRQANSQGLRVRKGEKGRKVVYYQFQKDAPVPGPDGKPSLDAEGQPITKKEPLERPLLRLAPVFHVSQLQDTDGNPVPPLGRAELAANPHDKTESLLQASGVAVKHDQRDRSFYRAATDAIHMPPKAAFDSEEKYYSTVLHELAHSAGHESRLNREKSPLGSPEYAKEELRAQIAAWMLAQDLGAAHHPAQSAAYVETWVKVLEKDPYEIVRACRDAEKIKEYVMGMERGLETDKELSQAPAGEGARERSNEKVYLEVPFQEKDQARAAGAKWDNGVGCWYAPAGSDLEKFRHWMPEPEQSEEKALAQEPPARTPRPALEKTRLEVGYEEKEQAKAAGAKWDLEAKVWYAPEGADLSKLEAWLPSPDMEIEAGRQKAGPVPALRPEQEFFQALTRMGLNLEGKEPVMDGQMRRVSLFDSKPGSLDGAYVGHLDGHPAGFIQNHKSGEVANWKYSGHVLSPESRQELSAAAVERKAEQAREREAERERAEKRAYAKFVNAAPAVLLPEQHPYLVKKGIESLGALTDGQGNLLIFGQDVNSRIQTVQTISPEGEKRFEKGCAKTGAFFVMEARDRLFNHDKDVEKKNRPLLIAEGFATAASIHMATNYPVIVAFDSSNLKHVAQALHERRPDAPILICGDNDHSQAKNVGLQAAMEAAQAVSGRFVVPSFTDAEKAQGLSDFNDLHQSRGLEAVAKIVEPELKKSLSQAKARGRAVAAGPELGQALGM